MPQTTDQIVAAAVIRIDRRFAETATYVDWRTRDAERIAKHPDWAGYALFALGAAWAIGVGLAAAWLSRAMLCR